MASPCVHGNARIKVQVVATLLSLDIPVHVNSFWMLVRFSETPRICNVEDNILSYLNSMAKKCPFEIVAHDRPITPSWTYVPVSSSSANCTSLRQQNTFSNSSSLEVDNTPPVQELTILLKPPVSDYGTKNIPPKPILMSYNISASLPKSTKLIFKKQLVLMQDSVLLDDSKSDILRDNDVIVINTICAFYTVETFDSSKSLNHETDSLDIEVELDSLSVDTFKDVDHCLIFDVDEESNHDVRIELSPEIQTKFDRILQKLAGLKNPHKFDKSAGKSKKRKICKEDSSTELNNDINAYTGKNGHRKQKQKKMSADEQLIEDHNDISTTNELDVLVSKTKKSKKNRGFEALNDLTDSMGIHLVHATNVIAQESPKTGPHLKGTLHDETQGCPATDMEVSVQSVSKSSRSKKRKPDFRLSNLLSELRNQQAVEVNEGNHKTESINKGTQKQVKDSSTDVDMNVSTTGNKSKKKESKVEIDSLDLLGRSFTPAPDMVKKSQTVSSYNTPEGVKPQDCPAVQMEVSMPPVNPSSTNKRKPTGFGLSNLLCALRNQPYVDNNEENDKTKLIITENENLVNSATENIVTNTSDPVKHLDSSQTTTKRKRVRKRKNKKLNVSASTSNSEIHECRERDYTLKLAEHHMPQNNRVTFEGDSEDDMEMNQIVFVAQSTPVLNQHEQFRTQNSFTENRSPQREVTHTCADDITAKSDATISDVTITSFSKAGAAIDPGEKFQALLNQCGKIGRQFETTSSAGGHAVIRSLRQKRDKLKIADAVDPERDVLINVSTIKKQAVKADTSASSTTGYKEHTPSASGDNNCELSFQHGHKMLPKNHSNTTQENKYILPEVEASPLSVNYVLCQELHGLPMEGDSIAYKILELSNDYTPGLSNFKEAKVINVNTQTGSLLLELKERKDNELRTGRFEMSLDDTEEVNNEEVNLVEVDLTDLVDLRLVYRSGNKD